MALSRTNVCSVQSATSIGAAAFTSASQTIPSADMMVAIAYGVGSAAASSANLTIADSRSHTWTSRMTADAASWAGSPAEDCAIRVWTAPITNPGSGTFTIDGGADVFGQIGLTVLAYSGIDTSSPIGATATNTRSGTDGAVTLTLSGAPVSASEVIGFLVNDVNSGSPTATPGSGFTELYNVGTAGWTFSEVQVRTGSTSTSVPWVDINDSADSIFESMAIAFEVKATAGFAADNMQIAVTSDNVVLHVPNPVVASSTFEVGTSLGSTNAQPLPAGAAAGDLIIYVIGNDTPSTTAISVSTGWTLLSAQTQGSNVIKGDVAVRVLDGTTGNNILSVTGAAQDYSIAAIRIATGNHSVVQASIATDVKIAGTTGASGNADPPNLNPAVTKDWLWLAAAIIDTTTASTLTAAPTNYAMVQNNKSAASTSSVITAVAARNPNNASSENPGTFTNSSLPWITYTIGIPPFVSGLSLVVADMQIAATSAVPTLVQHNVLTGVSDSNIAVTMGSIASLTDPPFVTGVSANGRYLIDQYGNPILVVADWGVSLTVDLDETEMETYFANREANGVNAVVVALIAGPNLGGINADGRNIDGITPFTNTTTLALRSTYWSRVDTMFELAADHGITIFANPMGVQDWTTMGQTAGTTNTQNYGATLATRYASQPNIVWMLGIDYTSDLWAANDAWQLAMRDGLKTDPSKLLTIQLAYHKSAGTENSNWSATGVIDFWCSYSYWPTYDANFDAYLTDPPGSRTAMPVFMSEANFTDENNWGGVTTTDETIRRQFWWSLLCGAYATSYGHHDVWQFNTGWDSGGNLNDPPLLSLHLGRTMLETFQWYNLVPAKTGIITTGQGTYSDDNAEDVLANAWAASAQTADKTLTMCYFPTSRSIVISLTGIPTNISAYWWDPVSGDTVTEGSPATPTHPGTNDDGVQDWVLVIRGGLSASAQGNFFSVIG